MNKIQWVDFSPRWLTQLSSWHKDFPDLWEVSELSPSPVVPDSQPRVRRLFANHKPALMQKNTSYWAAECLHCTRAIEFHLFNYLFIFYKFIIYLKGKVTQRRRHWERDRRRERDPLIHYPLNGRNDQDWSVLKPEPGTPFLIFSCYS